jgi:hypothetical protein
VRGQPPPHRLAQRLEIALVTEVLLARGVAVTVAASTGLGLLGRVAVRVVVLDDAAEAGPDRVDEDEVGEGEPRFRVGDEPRWHLRQRPGGGEGHTARADGAHVQERRRGARAAIEDEGDRTLLIGARGVGDGEDLGRGLLLLAQDDPLRAHRIVDREARPRPGARGLGPARRLVAGLPRGLLVPGALIAHGQDASRIPRRCVTPARVRGLMHRPTRQETPT